MASFIFKLNNKCNANCIFCEIPTEKKRMDEPLLEDQLIKLKKGREKFDSLILSGGEPSIYRHIFTVLKEAKKMGYKHITIESNGIIFSYMEFVKKLKSAGVDHFQVSYHTSDPKAYDVISGVPNSHRLAKEGIKNLKALGAEVHANVVVNRFNYKTLPDTFNELISLNIDTIQLSFVNPIGSNMKEGKAVSGISYTEALPYINETFRTAKDLAFFNITAVNFPRCISKEFIASKIFTVYNTGEQAKIWPQKCNKCRLKKECEGVWSAYLEQYGDSELVPL